MLISMGPDSGNYGVKGTRAGSTSSHVTVSTSRQILRKGQGETSSKAFSFTTKFLSLFRGCVAPVLSKAI